MKNTTRLPDAMPDIEKRTLLAVCSAHECMFIDVGGHTLMMHDNVKSKTEEFSDHEGRQRSPAAMGRGGLVGGNDDANQMEDNRLREFSNDAVKHLDAIVRDQKIEEIYLSAPGKFLHALKKHLPKHLEPLCKVMVDGNFFKESPIDLLVRFRPDLEEGVRKLREQENYSPKNRPPSK